MSLIEVLKKGNYTLIDVREPMELDVDGSIEGAINIPLGELEMRKDEILSLKGDVVVFCRGGHRSAKALEFLQNEGLENGINGGGYSSLSEILDTI